MINPTHLPLLLEVGTDELPARFQPVELKHMRQGVAALLADAGLSHGEIKVMAAPRRLAILVSELQVRQPDREIELKGPPARVCFDDEGKPTKAAEGFARKNGIDLADAYEVTDEKGGVFLGARKIVGGRAVGDILSEQIPPLLLSIPFPKMMRWGYAETLYARPIQWLIAMLGSEIIPMSVAGVESSNTTRGHRTLADSCEITIDEPEHYEAQLLEHGVVVDQDERRRRIESGIEACLVDLPGGQWLQDDELMTEVVHLCEFPTPLIGTYHEEFFALPDEVIVTALKAHQRYFAVGGHGGGLLPNFIAVRDGNDVALDNVRRGNERVLRARLSDALFYWNFDQKKTPDEHTDSLEAVTWIEGYGSMKEKVARVASLSEWLWGHGLGDGIMPPALKRAAAISRFDMVTEMIKDGKEFTKLEGLIGARYAAEAGESDSVCRILEEFHRPRSAVDVLPGDRSSAVLSAAERADTLAGCWLAGFIPTGAKDPYALRRHSLALLRILLDAGVKVDIRELLETALNGYATQANDEARHEAKNGLFDFITTRLEGYLAGGGLDLDVVRATLPLHGHDPVETRAWAEALSGFRSQDDFLKLAQGFKRCRNILGDETLAGPELGDCRERWRSGAVTASYADLPEPAEKLLLTAISSSLPDLDHSIHTGDRVAVLNKLSTFGPLIDDFFDSVRVNAEDGGLRASRRAFLGEVQGLFAGYADFTVLAPVENLSS